MREQHAVNAELKSSELLSAYGRKRNGRNWWKADRLLFRVYPHSRRLQAEWPIVVGGGPLSALRPLLPEHVICNHAEPDEKAERRADQKKGQVHGDGSRPAPTIRLVAHASSPCS
jgi:hypothetical protein